jgi:hypothetical protein
MSFIRKIKKHYYRIMMFLDQSSNFSYAQEGPYISGYMECQEEMGKMYTLEEIQKVLDGFTGDAPGFYIKTNFIELLKKLG